MTAEHEMRLVWSEARGWQLAPPLPETLEEILTALRPASTPFMIAMQRKGTKP